MSILKKCEKCNKEFFVKPSLYRQKFCSRSCSQTGKKLSDKTKDLLRVSSSRPRPYRRGPKYLWSNNDHSKPEKSSICLSNREIRRSKEYAFWRKSVFERDNFTCQDCMVRGSKLNADHIKPFAFFPELRLDINNGRTLCEDCHKKTPTYKSKINIYE